MRVKAAAAPAPSQPPPWQPAHALPLLPHPAARAALSGLPSCGSKQRPSFNLPCPGGTCPDSWDWRVQGQATPVRSQRAVSGGACVHFVYCALGDPAAFTCTCTCIARRMHSMHQHAHTPTTRSLTHAAHPTQQCGSCAAFAAMAAIEVTYALANNVSNAAAAGVNLSEQELLDVSDCPL